MVTKKDISFGKTYAAIPCVIACLGGSMAISASAAAAYADIQVSASNVSKTGFSIYLANSSNATVEVAVRYIVIRK